jgi:AhpD family alkylhydroperoxidase
MQARMKNPAMILPDAMQALMDLQAATEKGGVSPELLGLVHLRASQINGCDACMTAGICQVRKAGESEDRLTALENWKVSPHFTDAERAALALTEAVTRLSDQKDAVPDAVWNEATRYYNEKALAALILSIATTNVYNRLNVTTRQIAGSWEG